MDQRIRLLTAATVLLVGLGLALLFRHPVAESDLAIPLQSGPLVLRNQPDRRTFVAESSPGLPQSRPLPVAPGEPPRQSPTIVTPTDRPAPPPELPRSYPNSGQPVSTRWGASLSEMLPAAEGAPASAPPTHKVVDGDSLALLAQRYLGSASRAMEIYEANRNVLPQPEILPIGAELKIPRADRASAVDLSQKP
jgi:nucleoid-associated protein YgaU